MKDFRDKVAVITGGASGLGLAMARRAAANGMKLVLADIEEGRGADRAALAVVEARIDLVAEYPEAVFPAGVADGTRDHDRLPGGGGRAGGADGRGRVRRQPHLADTAGGELAARDLEDHVRHALPHLGSGAVHLRRSIGTEPDARAAGVVEPLREADVLEPDRVADATPDADRVAVDSPADRGATPTAPIADWSPDHPMHTIPHTHNPSNSVATPPSPSDFGVASLEAELETPPVIKTK